MDHETGQTDTELGLLGTSDEEREIEYLFESPTISFRRRRRKRLSGAQLRKRRTERLRAWTGGGSASPNRSDLGDTEADLGSVASPSQDAASAAVLETPDTSSESIPTVPKRKNQEDAAGSSRTESEESQPTREPTGEGETLPSTDSGVSSETDSARAAKVRRTGPSDWDVVPSNLQVAVIDRSSPFGKITSEQADVIEAMLTRELDRQFSHDVVDVFQEPIVFEGLVFSGGILRISCGNERARDWLREAVSANSALWEGARLDMVEEDMCPRLIRANINIPGRVEEDDVVMRRLRWQNPRVKVGRWCRLQDTVGDGGKLMVFSIDEEDYNAILSQGGKLSYKFSSISVTMDP